MKNEQSSFNFEQPLPPPEPVREVEIHEQDECLACGNAIESDSPGCFQCRGNKVKITYQKHRKKEGKIQ